MTTNGMDRTGENGSIRPQSVRKIVSLPAAPDENVNQEAGVEASRLDYLLKVKRSAEGLPEGMETNTGDVTDTDRFSTLRAARTAVGDGEAAQGVPASAALSNGEPLTQSPASVLPDSLSPEPNYQSMFTSVDDRGINHSDTGYFTDKDNGTLAVTNDGATGSDGSAQPQWARQSAEDVATSEWPLVHNLSGSYGDYGGAGGDWFFGDLDSPYNLSNTSSPWWGSNSNTTTVEPIPDGYLSGYTLPHVILASIFVTALMIIIVFGNALVIIAIAKDRHLKAVQNWFIASLAVSDLFVGLLIMPLSLTNELMGYWVFGQILCELWLATDVLLCTASILNLCLISLDRYWSITRAVSYVKQRTMKRAMVMIALVWFLSMIICFPPLVGWKRPQSTTKWGHPLCTLTDDIGYVIYSTLGSFYVPLIVMVVVYFKIYLAARSRARRGLKNKPKPAPVNTSKIPTDNGKSPTPVPVPAPVTTTSFSTPSKVPADNKVCSKEFDSLEEEPEPVPSCHVAEGTMATSTVTSSEAENTANNGQVVVPMTTLHHMDEKRKLLASELEDTDSACESTPKHEDHLKGRRKFSQNQDETDSTSDTGASKPPKNRVSLKGKIYNEENMKPLLEDSQLESDCDTVRGIKSSNKNNNVDNKDDDVEEGHSVVDDTTGAKDELQENRLTVQPAEEEHQDKKKKHILLSPSTFRKISMHVRKTHITSKKQHTQHTQLVEDTDSRKRRIARARERRANLVLGIVMGTFILCWFPFFSTYVIASLTGIEVPGMVFAVFFWGGYCNSALNPIIYTIFNREFKQAFQRLLCPRKRNTRLK